MTHSSSFTLNHLKIWLHCPLGFTPPNYFERMPRWNIRVTYLIPNLTEMKNDTSCRTYTKGTLLLYISFNCLLALNFNFFSISRILFHLSFTVLLHYQASKLLGLESGFSLFKQYTTCTVLLFFYLKRTLQGLNLLWLKQLNN